MGQRRSTPSTWAWAWVLLALAALAAAEWTKGSNAAANHIPGAQRSRREWCASVCGDGQGVEGDFGRCPNPCPACPAAPPSRPPPICPEPKCPTLPAIPPCPTCPLPICPKPVCPALPPIPPCPVPRVNLTCPKPQCAAALCAKCPTCPPPPPVSPVRKARPSGYEGWPTAPVGIYKLFKSKASWIDANNTCFKEGAHLVIPNTKAEVQVLTDILKKNNIGIIQAGFHDNYQEGQYISVLGAPMDSVQKSLWDTHQPGGGKGENCATLYKSGRMHDYHCSSQFPFVCEVPY